MAKFSVGQRWVSEMEPELGLGVVDAYDDSAVIVFFPASDCRRRYSIHSAPLQRVVFKVGDQVKSRYGQEFVVSDVTDENGLLTYFSETDALSEADLCDRLSISSPEERLMNGFVGNHNDFTMRCRVLQHQHAYRRSANRGLMGARIDLIPHQMYVVQQVSAQPFPRVLLSDETGLGKTIEVCLVLHRLLTSGRIGRVLIVVPQTLVHQWFVELLRKFNLFFRIVDEPYCDALVASDPECNPFEQDQLALCSLEFLASHPWHHNEAVAAGWDMVVMDEAHHLTEGSVEYHIAEELGSASKGMMLLTATPEQLGHRSHFSRLRLLDPARYHDFDAFEDGENAYLAIAEIVNALLENETLSTDELKRLKDLSPGIIKGSIQAAQEHLSNDSKKRESLIAELLDRHGTGRAIFRNTRATMSGFPERKAHLIPLNAAPGILKADHDEFESVIAQTPAPQPITYEGDPRISWLVDFLKNDRERKVLLICRTLEKALAIDHALRHKTNADIALFHEDLSIIQRDRNAAYFAEKDGAQILICSEIGSEGRNFQFAHDLVLFDLPLDPEVLEQRIGRLDRIGQKKTIQIHVPYIIGSPDGMIAYWYHHGLDAFEKNVPGVYRIYCELGPELVQLIQEPDQAAFDAFIQRTQRMLATNKELLLKGRDRLLELNSFRPAVAQRLIEELDASDSDDSLEEFMLDIFQHFGIRTEEIDFRTYRLDLTMLSCPDFPLPRIKRDEVVVTFCRRMAVKHETMTYLTWDHPMVIGSMDLIQSSENGICAMANWPDSERKVVLLEAVFILECLAPPHLYADRFLSPHPVRAIVDHHMRECGKTYTADVLEQNLEPTQSTEVLDNPHIKQGLLPRMLDACREQAQSRADDVIEAALNAMERALEPELKRLVELRKTNKALPADLVANAREEMDQLKNAISSSRIRLDALRFITRGTF